MNKIEIKGISGSTFINRDGYYFDLDDEKWVLSRGHGSISFKNLHNALSENFLVSYKKSLGSGPIDVIGSM